ncbi:hypothetical protein [Leptospira sp. GIMC2001]|uniref:hypothetical protein n=1 Tax=Leptospira sp. GIMC2001 TaxID=1513297 RepID=UPI00234A208A|nr:hypothetical protein [Leptospira sp. GIMC2001]WCL48338.1 hypothetical protein O4O04_13615 [Leptospira sp. GIMC2001]
MSDAIKKSIEKNSSGEYIFTPYGEFLSYFHAHLEIFKRFCKSKNYQPAKTDQLHKNLKSFMASNVKNVDQFFQNIPKFAEILEVSKDELSAYLNKNFLEALPAIQDKFKASEIKKLSSSPNREFERVTEEILEMTSYQFPAGHRFTNQNNVVVLENIATGEVVEPQGLMVAAAASPAMIGADPKAESKPAPVRVFKEDPFLQELHTLFGDEFSGEKIVVESEIEENHSPPAQDIAVNSDDVLEDIEDIDFEEPESEEELDDPHESGVLDDLGDILGHGSEEEVDYSEPEPTIEPEIENFRVNDFFNILQQVNSYQAKQDNSGYQSWLASSDDLTRVVVSLRSNHLKEVKGEAVSWDSIVEQMESKTKYDRLNINDLKGKVVSYHWVKISLDRAAGELRKGSPELLQLVKMAWPHIQKAFMNAPDYELVLTNLKNLVSKVKEEPLRKEMIRILTLTLNFLKTKYPPI